MSDFGTDLSSRVALERQTRPLRYAVRKQKSKTKVNALRNPILHKDRSNTTRFTDASTCVRSGTAALRRRHLPASTTHRHPTAIQQSHRCAPLRTARHGRRSAQRGSSSATPLALLSDVRATAVMANAVKSSESSHRRSTPWPGCRSASWSPSDRHRLPPSHPIPSHPTPSSSPAPPPWCAHSVLCRLPAAA